jgi:allophanate hydrolase subunit 2
VRVVVGPHGEWFPPDALTLLTSETWTVRRESDRVGLRLDGPRVPRRSGDMVSGPMTWGAIQVPPDGTPIVLLADHQTVGGYPVVATVARADWPLIGQLAPGDQVRFTIVDVASAQSAFRDAMSGLRDARRLLDAAEAWHGLWRSADG